MLEGRSDSRVARWEVLLEVSFADIPTAEFRYLDFRFERFEITVSPPHAAHQLRPELRGR
jgi:hypothetical protein